MKIINILFIALIIGLSGSVYYHYNFEILSLFSYLFGTSSSLGNNIRSKPWNHRRDSPGRLGTYSPPPKPSVRTTKEEELSIDRGIYGGVGDKPHLGGFTDLDIMGISNNTFNFMFGPMGLKSVVDVGCGKGVSTSIFRDIGARVLCVEGSHDAVQKSLLPSNLIIEHDFSRGPWWPEETFDAAWAVEFVEHVGRQYMGNYIPIFRRAALIFMTHSPWGGWHHVEVHPDWWWQTRLEAQGFLYSAALTEQIRLMAKGENEKLDTTVGQHIWLSMQVFINPEVAALPQHAHIMGGWGCFNEVNEKGLESYFNHGGAIRCKNPDQLPRQYAPLLDCRRSIMRKELWNCVKTSRE